jgi:hypothetical protein
MIPTIPVLPHAIDRYIARVMREVPPDPRSEVLDRFVASEIRAAIVNPGSQISRLMWRPEGFQRFVLLDGVRYVVRAGKVVTVMLKREERAQATD